MNLSDLLDLNDKNLFIGIVEKVENNTHISNINSPSYQFNAKQEIEKLTAIIAHQEKEISYLKEIIELLKNQVK